MHFVVSKRMVKAFLILAALALLVPVSVVDVGTEPGGRLASEWLRPRVTVGVSYVHSVEMTCVKERYCVDAGGIYLTSMRWESTGAGLPDSYDSWENGRYVTQGRLALGKRLAYWFLPLSDPEIRVNDRIVLQGLERPGQVWIRVRTMPLAVRLVVLATG